MKNLKENTTVWFVHRACADVPVRQGTIEAIFSDCVEIWDDVLGEVTADFKDVFETRQAAEAALEND